ncbi:MAG: undecaprenyl phosphate translocase family protein, partial [Candidatus Coproplasma sp.]
ISGSMLMLIFGYYEPLLGTISALRTDFGHSLLVLAIFALGVVVGFFTIAKAMQLLLNKFRRPTMWAIAGFVLGSIPAVIITFFNNYGVAYLDPLQICLGVATFIIGGVATFFIARFAEKKQAEAAKNSDISESKTEE